MKFYKPALAFIIFISAILTSLCIKDGHNWGGDFALYIEQTIALNNSTIYELYEANKYTIQNSEIEIGPYLYPFGFPFLLLPLYKIFGLNFIVFKIFCALCFVLALPLLASILKKHIENHTFVLLIISAIAFHSGYLIFTSNILSDLPFLFFCLLCVWLMQQKVSIVQQVLLGICLYYSYFIRDIGIVLLPTFLVYQLQNKSEWRNQKKIILLLPYLIFAFLFVIAISTFPLGSENHYKILLSQLTFERVATNCSYYFMILSSFFLGENTPVAIFYPILVFVIIGMLIQVKKLLHLITFCLGAWLIISLWPAQQDIRFLFPIIPFILLFFVLGIKFCFIKLKISLKSMQLALAALTLLLCYFNISRTIEFGRGNTNEVLTEEVQKMYSFIKKNTGETDLIAAYKPPVLRLFTGRNSIYVASDHFMSSPAKYLLTEQADYKLLSDSCKLLYQSGIHVLLSKKRVPS